MAQRIDLKFYRETYKAFYIVVKNASTRAYEDITDWTIYFTVKSKSTDTDENAVLKKDITTHVDPTNGKTLIELMPDDLSMDIGNYWYDIVGKDSDDKPHMISIGKLQIKRKITQRSS